MSYADQRHLGARLGGDHADDAADHALGAEHRDLGALEPAARPDLSFLDERDHGGGGGEGAGGVGEDRDLKRRKHRLLGGLRHVERQHARRARR